MSQTKINQKWWQSLPQFSRFMSMTKMILPWLIGITLILLAIGLFLSFRAPFAFDHEETVRIMYIHVPFAWISLLCYVIMSIAAICSLLWHLPLANILLKSATPIGAVFTLLALMTGSFWGRPAWGTWWISDARLNSMLALFFIYVVIIIMCNLFDSFAKSMKAASIITLIGLIDIPLIKFSVYWFNSLHQTSSIIRKGGPAIDPSMLIPLLAMAIAFTFLFTTLLISAMRNEITRQKVRSLEIRIARSSRPESIFS